jgi:hypothetical protein
MQTIVAPIKHGESGTPVANLQDALLALLERKIIQPLDAPNRPTVEELQKLTEGLKREREQSQFSKATQQLIFYFQIQQGIGDNLRNVGVEEKTAAKLNELLKKLGLLDIAEPDGFIVRGTVTTSDGQPVSGATVRAFDRDMRKKPPVGDAETDVHGQFIIRYGLSQFALGDEPSASGPSLIVRAFANDQQIGDDVIRTKATREEVVNFTLPAPPVSEWERLSTAIIPLLKGQGDKDQTLPPWEINDSDLTFIVEETGLDREQIRLWALAFAVGREAAVVVQPGSVTGSVSNIVTRAVPPINANDFLAFAVFYGWFRLGLPSEPSALWATTTETLLTTLSTAIEQGIVPSNAGADLSSLSKRIEQFKLDRVLQAPGLGIAAPLGDLLGTLPVPLNVDQARAIAATAPELLPDDPNLVNRIADIPGLERNAAVGVARTLRLGALTGGHLPLTQTLQDRLQSGGESEGTLRPLAALRPDEWLDLAYTHGVPDGTAITPVAYADAIAASIEQQHPTAALAAHFTEGRRLAQHPALTDVGTFLQGNADFNIVTANLNAVIDKEKLGGVPEPQHAQLVDGLRALQRMKVLGASWDETAALLENDLYSPHQLLAAGPTQLTALLGDRIAPERITALYVQAEELHNVTFAAFTAAFSPLSAPRILAMNQFVTPPSDPPNPDDLGGVILPDLPTGGDVPHTGDPAGDIKLKDFADAVAHHLANREMALDPGWGRVVPSPRSGIVIPDKTPKLDLSPFIDHQPTLQALFGAQDACACCHCNSVLGPAAYFVDVLQFIKNGGINGKLLAELLRRRPDLQDIELSCNNTNTEVPAIDLALEILENAVALPLDVPLDAGVDAEAQLSGSTVGKNVRDALEKTVRSLQGEVQAKPSGSHEPGTTDWTVVDGYRRWTLTVQKKNLRAQTATGKTYVLDTKALSLSSIVAALDNGQIFPGAEPPFAGLLAVNQKQPPDLTNYGVKITPLVPGKSWRVGYQIVAELLIDSTARQLLLQTQGGVVWWKQEYDERTLEAVENGLEKDTVPELVQGLLALRFSETRKLRVKSTRAKSWTITSDERTLPLEFTSAGLTISALTYQSGDPSADALAWPENHNPEAYVQLKKPSFPWSLPVDLPLEEVRLFLERARSSRRRLLELMMPVDQLPRNDAVLALEVLGLNEAEANLIGAEKTAPAVYDSWGVSERPLAVPDRTARYGYKLVSVAPLDQLKNVSILLQQSRLGFEELQAVLATRFVAGGTTPLTIEPQTTCKPSEMTLPTLTPRQLDRLHRFTRLWRKLGWTMHELDLAIQAFGGEIQPDTLISLARLRRLKQELKLPVTALVGGLHLLETEPWTDYLPAGATVHPSLYDTMFQREAVRSMSDFADFALLADRTELKNTPNLGISAHKDYVGAGLAIKSSVLVEWVAGADGLGIEDKLNLANLSRLSAAASLCRGLGINPEKLTHHLKLYGAAKSPFQSGISAHQRADAMLEFIERFRSVELSGIEVETLRYLLQDYVAEGSNVDLDETQLTDLAVAVRNAVQSVPDAPGKTPPVAPTDPEGDETRVAREREAARIIRENEALALATRTARENAAIAALATGLGAAPELVDDLLRVRLLNPADPGTAAIEVFLSSLGDFIDLPGLLKKLRTQSDPVSEYLWNRFSAEDQLTLTSLTSTALQQQTTLVATLNQVLKGTSIYQTARFANVKLSAETLALNSARPSATGANLIRLNRLLLEDAYELEIAKRPLPDSTFVIGEVFRPPSAAVKSVLVRLHKASTLCDALNLSRTDLLLLRTSATDKHGFTVLDFNTLPTTDPAPGFDGFSQVLALSQLRRLASNAGDLLHKYAALTFPTAPAAAWSAEDAQQVLTTGLTITKDEVDAAAKQLRITTVDQYRDPITLTRLIELLVALKQLGATVEQAIALTAPSPDDATALSARELLRSKYGASQWHDLIKPIADKLRERQRDALVDYLIGRQQQNDAAVVRTQIVGADSGRGASDLYEFYLIDVQTSSCLKTTRLLQATAAVQLFVQRLLLNLEGGLSLADDKRKLWEWMHNYRVWEANRKVFLFPENWLLPELRDDKTATFGRMESAFTEGEPSRDTIQAALLGYVEELGELAQMNVIAMYEDYRTEQDEAGKKRAACTLYVVGRTPDQPYRYHWRSCVNFGSDEMSWSGWEALEVDNANDFIVPFVFEGDLHVAWPVFRQTKDEQDESKLWWQVQMAWTRRTSRGWVKRKIGEAHVAVVERLPNKGAPDTFTFQLEKEVLYFPFGDQTLSQETIAISIYAANEMGSTADFTPAFRPDPTLADVKDSDPVPSGALNNGDWNTLFSVEGVAYEYAAIDQATRYRPLVNMRIDLQWWTRKDLAGGTIRNSIPITTNAEGRFTFLSPVTTGVPSGVINGGEIALTFNWPGQKATVLKKTLALEGNGYAMWDWKFNIGVINKRVPARTQKTIADTYSTKRLVKRAPAGKFIIQSGIDLRYYPAANFVPPGKGPSLLLVLPPPLGTIVPEMSVEGNRFFMSDDPIGSVRPKEAMGIKLDDAGRLFPLTLSLPLFALPAIQSPVATGQARSPVWYIQNSDGGFYLQEQADGLHRWPDGQPFASAYRIAASVSTIALFQPGVESHLHVDSLANNFLRQFPYANYNWELFLHAPLAIADYMARQQNFEEARRWLHAVFDPTAEKKDKTTQQIPQFWRFLPFDNATQPIAIAKLLTWLADPKMVDPQDTQALEKELSSQVKEWEKNPFMPHVIARLRPSAYQWYTFFAYLDVLIGWGDQLFRRDTRESVNDATLLYILAAKLLGPRPRTIPAPTAPYALTYRLLRGDPNQIDSFSNAWVNYADLPGLKQFASTQVGSARSSQSFALLKAPGQPSEHLPIPATDVSSAIQHLTSLGALAFCVPRNEKVTEFYDRVENRLFNVRNCRNIDGVFRELPLYQPPIDPLLLIRAKAAGLDIDSVIADLYAPLPNYRFSFTLQKALELCTELKALGSALLTALEKKDAEDLTLLRSRHEIAMLKLVRDTRKQQVAEAEANIAAFKQSEATILERFGQYQKLLGKPGISKGQDGLPVVEQSSSLTVSTDAVGELSGLGLSRKEVDQLVLTTVANAFTQTANAANLIAGILSLFPDIWAGDALVAGQTFGGSNLGIGMSSIAKAMEMGAVEASYFANQAGTFGGYERRQDEWVHQSKLALSELKQVQQQIVAAEIRKDIAARELSNHDTQIENAQEVEDFMRSKFTNQQLYRWMSSQIAEVYFRTYQLTLDQARRAERAYQHELGLDNQTTPFVQSGQWDSLKRGLLAGEHLHHDLKRMESAYLERNVRELEITKHISLLQLDPSALIALKETGACDFDVPEVFFDLDYPGHYMRRIKMVSLSIPCVVGPYASVSATLRLTKNAIRFSHQVDAAAADSYTRKGTAPEDDPRFSETAATITAIVTSSAQQDSGMFEPNLRDERFLPFEGAGAISTWHLELPTQFESFDYDTISDVVLHLRYTARDGGDSLKTPVVAQLGTALDQIVTATAGVTAGGNPGLARLFSMRHEFPTEWYRFLNPVETSDGQTLEFELMQERFPLLFRRRTIQISRMDIFLKFKDASLVDYQGSAPLTVDLIPPGATPIPKVPPDPPSIPELVSDGSILNGLPHAYYDFAMSFDGPRTLGSWSLAIEEADITLIAPSLWTMRTASNGDHWRLKPAIIQDLFIVCRYSI